MRDALHLTHEITKLIKLSPRREAIFHGIKHSKLFGENYTAACPDLKCDFDPHLPHQRKVPKRFETGKAET